MYYSIPLLMLVELSIAWFLTSSIWQETNRTKQTVLLPVPPPGRKHGLWQTGKQHCDWFWEEPRMSRQKVPCSGYTRPCSSMSGSEEDHGHCPHLSSRQGSMADVTPSVSSPASCRIFQSSGSHSKHLSCTVCYVLTHIQEFFLFGQK